ncbi:MAG: hypothetical protein AAFU79_12075 [Myxococcota bacterium]
MGAKPVSFSLMPAAPFDEAARTRLEERLRSYPNYYDPYDDLYVLFGSEEERRETVALYRRETTPTFDVECFVQLRKDRLFLHPGEGGSALGHLRTFALWVMSEFRASVSYRNQSCRLDDVLPPVLSE